VDSIDSTVDAPSFFGRNQPKETLLEVGSTKCSREKYIKKAVSLIVVCRTIRRAGYSRRCCMSCTRRVEQIEIVGRGNTSGCTSTVTVKDIGPAAKRLHSQD
jgi:hypothetical protein